MSAQWSLNKVAVWKANVARGENKAFPYKLSPLEATVDLFMKFKTAPMKQGTMVQVSHFYTIHDLWFMFR